MVLGRGSIFWMLFAGYLTDLVFPFSLFALVPLGCNVLPRPAWWGPSGFSPFVGQADKHHAGTIPQPWSTESLLPSVLPALLTSTWSDFPSLFRLIKALLHSSLASMWSFPLWTLPRLPKEKGVALGWKGHKETLLHSQRNERLGHHVGVPLLGTVPWS